MRILVLFFIMFLSPALFCAQSLYQFDDPVQEQEFLEICKKLRCVTCPNQSLADSNAPVARSMRDEVYQMVKQGQSNAMIQKHFVARYGDYVIYQPQFKSQTWMLWLGPIIILLIGSLIFVRQIFQKASTP